MIRGLGEEVKEEITVKKILRSLPMIFNAKISTIEEMANLKDLKDGSTAWYSHDL